MVHQFINMSRLRLNTILILAVPIAIAITSQSAWALESDLKNDANQLIRQLREDQNIQKLRDNQPKQRPKLNIEPAAPAELPENAGALQFIMSETVVDGATLITQEEIDAVLKPWQGQRVSLAKLSSLAETLTNVYRNKGYPFSQVILPPQRIESGKKIHFYAIEGIIESVEVVGDANNDDPLIHSKFVSLINDPSVTIDRIETAMLLVRDLQGVEADASVTATGKSGRVKLIVDVKRDNFIGQATYHNMNSKALGRQRAMLMTQFNNLFGHQDYTQVSLMRTIENNEAAAFSLLEGMMLGDRGTRLEFSYSRSIAHPGEKAKPFDIDILAEIYTAYVYHLINRGRYFNWRVYGGLEYLKVNMDALHGISKIVDERLGTAAIGTVIDWRDDFISESLSTVKLDLRQGLSGKQALPSRVHGDPSFTSFRFFASRFQTVSQRTTLQLALGGQYAFDPLLASEQYSIGSYPFGRGYDPSTINGDHAFAGKLELRYDLTDFAAQIADLDSKRFSLGTFGFYDQGRTWDYHRSDSERIASTGLGIRGEVKLDAAQHDEHKSLDFELFAAWGLGDPIDPDKSGPAIRGRMVLNF